MKNKNKKKIQIIAEIAQGFEGNPYLANLLLDAFLKTNADIVKFQLVFSDELCTNLYEHYKLFKSLEMSTAVWLNLVKTTHKHNKKIFFDIYGPKSFKIAKQIGADGVKISTADFFNYSLIKESFKNFKNILISVSGRKIEDIDKLLSLNIYKNNVTILHGIQSEPTLLKDNNLLKINEYKEKYPNTNVGFMDHSLGNSDDSKLLPLVAIGAGADAIEKHLTLDRELKIEDYISALDVGEFTNFVKSVRNMEKSLGVKSLNVSKKEIEYVNKSSKIILAKKDLSRKTIINKQHINFKRTKVRSFKYVIFNPDKVLGKTLNKSIKKGLPILTKDLN